MLDAAPRSAFAPRMKKLGLLFSAAILGSACAVLYFFMDGLDLNELRAVIARTSLWSLVIALGFTALSYLLLTGYDYVALPQVTILPISYRLAALASFTSYAVSFTLGFPIITAATVRYWVYSRSGLRARAVASLTLIAGITFWLGMGCVFAVVTLFFPADAAFFTRLPLNVNRMIGALVVAGIVFYLVVVARKRWSFTVQGWRFRLPNIKITVWQMALGAADVCAGAAVIYTLFPSSIEVSFATLLAVYVCSSFLGIVSHSPGGLGVFEAAMLLALGHIPRETLLGVLLVYRICYYILPFTLALFLLGLREIMIRAGGLQHSLQQDGS